MNNWMWDHYENTVPMSTYLVAFVLSDFEFKETAPLQNDVTFRVWARQEVIDQVTHFRLNLCTICICNFKKYCYRFN